MNQTVESLKLSKAIKATPFSEEGWECLKNLGLDKIYSEEQLKECFF
jgi:hypothetical protein